MSTRVHAFGSSDRCAFCDVRWYRRNVYPCIDEGVPVSDIQQTTRSKHHKSSDVLSDFERTRDVHGGVISKAASTLGMTEAALQRALYRAKKAGADIHFTTSDRKANYGHQLVSAGSEAPQL